MKKLALFITLVASTIPLTSLAFDLGSAVRSYNITQSATARSRSEEHRLVEQLTKKIDSGNELFISESTRKDHFTNRLERALTESGIVPSYTRQTTNVVKIEQGNTEVYELWAVSLFKNKEGAERMAAERYYLFCDKRIIGTPGFVYYDMDEGVRTIGKTYLITSVFTETEYHGSAKKAYDTVCNQARPTNEQ